jgi:hypothetical protein
MAPGSRLFEFSRLCVLTIVLGFLLNLVDAAKSTKATILIIAKDIDAARSAHSGLQGYGIPYRVLVVQQAGATLPVLNSSSTIGNFGGIVVLSEVAYDYGTGYRSGLTDAQWTQLYAYQKDFKVRMARLDVYPGPNFGKTKHLSASERKTVWLMTPFQV